MTPAKNLFVGTRPFARFSLRLTSRDEPAQGDNSEFCGIAFIDSERTSWNLDPSLLAETLAARARAGKLPKAVIPVHLYGQSADLDPILAACARHDVPVIEDAAEALGATYWGAARPQADLVPAKSGESGQSASYSVGRPPGAFGWAGIFSFNSKEIITTSGGGMCLGR